MNFKMDVAALHSVNWLPDLATIKETILRTNREYSLHIVKDDCNPLVEVRCLNRPEDNEYRGIHWIPCN